MRWRALSCLALLACGGEEPAPAAWREGVLVFTDWIRVESSCGYAFRAPPDVLEQEAQGFDSCVDRWTAGGCDYSGDYGAFSSDLGEYRDSAQYQERQAVIDGRDAKLVTALLDGSYVAGVYFPEVDPDAAGLRLTIGASCLNRAAQEDALSVFQTVTFAP